MFDALTKIIPIVMFIAIGYWLQRKAIADDHTMHMIKKGIINLALPAVLFLAFKNMSLKSEYIVIAVISFVMMNLFYLAGVAVNKLLKLNSLIIPFLSTGFAFGLLGLPLFGGVYGLENVGILSVLGIGNELFSWFIYMTLVKQKMNGESFSKATITNFFKSPIIRAILIGLMVNSLNLNPIIEGNILLKGFELTLISIASLTTPLILIIIGYGIKLEKSYIKKSLGIILIRSIIILGIGYFIKLFVIPRFVGETTAMFDMAFYTYLILPPPFMLAIFVGEYSTEENTAITNNTIVISTILCVTMFIVGVVVAGL